MLQPIDEAPDGVIALRAVGQFTIANYRAVIEPGIGDVDGDSHLRLLLQLGDEFDGFGEGAWGKLTADIRRIPFHRGAVVTDDRFIRTGIDVLKWTLHGHVRTFGNSEFDQALAWVSE